MSSDTKNAIGVFDSGLGGLTVVRELIRQLPNENIVYYGDTARVPYGIKSKDSIIKFSVENTKVLLKNKVKMIVVACNSSSSYAIPSLQKKFKVPVIGVIKPGAKSAVEMTRNKRIGIIATTATIKSQKYTKSIQSINRNIKVFARACPLFVPLVEEGWLNNKVTQDVAKRYLLSLKKAKIDTLILGCTHYPLLKGVVQKTMGQKVRLVDSAKVVAGEVRRILIDSGLDYEGSRKVKYKFLVSDKPQEFNRIAKNFLGKEIKARKI